MRRSIQKAVFILFVVIAGIFAFGQMQQVSQMKQTIEPSESSDFFTNGFSTELTSPPGEREFEENQDYPQQLFEFESPQGQPWRRFDFKENPMGYLYALLKYGLNGNFPDDCTKPSNPAKWFHMPNMYREKNCGLTEERPSEYKELHPDQKGDFQNWAVSVYNQLGGSVIGKVWKNGVLDREEMKKIKFPEGTMAIKFLYTEAPEQQVPYLKGSPQIFRKKDNGKLVALRLLQIDVAVRDRNADSTTGWVFGTFMYNGNINNTDWRAKIVPIGLMYGNDPDKIPFFTKPLSETIYNPRASAELPQGYSYLKRENGGRLVGPVDNKYSSCLSCHSNSDFPKQSFEIDRNRAPNPNASDATKRIFFRNIGAGNTFKDPNDYYSMDYSLQFQISIWRYNKNNKNFLNILKTVPRGRGDKKVKD